MVGKSTYSRKVDVKVLFLSQKSMTSLNQEDLKLLQDNILYIAVKFDQFCQKNNINYFLLGGTALGAIRHGGFIPWDVWTF